MSTPRILHIAQDEKFINAAFYLFEKAFPASNKFVIVKPPANPPIRFLNKKVVENSQMEVRSAHTVAKILVLSSQFDIIVFHGLDDLKGEAFLRSPNKNRFMTIIYGAEIYNRQLLGNRLLGIKSQKLSAKLKRTTLIEAAKNVYRKFAYRNVAASSKINIRDVLREMPVYGSLPSFSQKKFVEMGIYRPDVKKVPFSYYPLEFIIKNENQKVQGGNILLGNSASSTNNHLEAFDLLKKMNLGERKIITPLSYGSPKYAKAIKMEGKKIFGASFVPLTTFYSLKEFNAIISQCGIVIMNHYRPQAMGTIISALYMGAKVFLNDTDVYQYFRQMGCHIFLIEGELTPQNNSFELLNDEQIAHNREILRKEFSTSALVDKMRVAFDEVFHIKHPKREVV